jgi:hypothetical protein
MKRKLLARSNHIATRQRIYRVSDGIEVDEVDHFEVRRSRVLYEDVILITYHRYRGIAFPLVTGGLALGFGALAVWAAQAEPVAGWTVAAITVPLPLLAFLLRMIFGMDEVNVYSKRTQAALRFLVRKRRARALMNEIGAAVRARQRPFAASAPKIDAGEDAGVAPAGLDAEKLAEGPSEIGG